MARALAKAPHSRRACLKVTYERSIEQVGIAETTRLAIQRFRDVAEQYVANLWLRSEWHAAWFERACQPKVDDGLRPKAVNGAPKRASWNYIGLGDGGSGTFGRKTSMLKRSLAEGRKVFERSHNLLDGLGRSRAQTDEMWKTTQNLISSVQRF